MSYTMVEKITMQDGKLCVPENPIIPFVEGDGTGPDITRAAMTVWNAAIEKALLLLAAYSFSAVPKWNEYW